MSVELIVLALGIISSFFTMLGGVITLALTRDKTTAEAQAIMTNNIATMTQSVGTLVLNINSLVVEREQQNTRINHLEDEAKSAKLEVAEIRSEMQKMADDHKAEIVGLKAKHFRELEAFKKAQAADIQTIKDELTDNHKSEIAAIKKAHGDEMQELRALHKKQIDDMQLKLDQANGRIQALENQMTGQLVEAKSAMTSKRDTGSLDPIRIDGQPRAGESQGGN